MSRPAFLERRTYRRRRLIDAVRLLPLAALILFIVPALMSGAADGFSTARLLVYFFGIWLALIALAAVCARRLTGADRGD